MADQVDEIKQKTDIVSVISEYQTLKKAGRNFKGLCPFHNEKTPSFMVSPELQIYKCFGCGESGDVISFLQKRESMDFYEALKFLAGRVGVKLEPFKGEKLTEKEKIYSINSLAAKVYQFILFNHKSGKNALSYLTEKRGLKLDTIRKFEIGYSPENSKAITSFFLQKKKYQPSDLTFSGIFYKRGMRLIDRFAGRIIFPLYDHRGNVVGFSGRVLPETKTEMGKYINSPETPTYHKSYVLYGLNLSRDFIKKAKNAIVVEGELDLISSWQSGIKNIVAIKGTAFTEDQIKLLSRFCDTLTLCLDSDSAGSEATKKSIFLAEKNNLNIQVASIKKYKDPDEMARENPQGLKKLLEKSENAWDFLLDSVFSKYDSQTGLGKRKISRELIPAFSQITDNIVQAHYAKKLAEALSVPESSVLAEISKTTPTQSSDTGGEMSTQKKSRRELLEQNLLSVVFRFEPTFLKKKDISSLFNKHLYKKIIDQYFKYSERKKDFDISEFSKYIPSELFDGFSSLVLDQALNETDLETYKKEMEKIIREINILDTRQKIDILREKILLAEKNKESAKIVSLRKKIANEASNLNAFEEER